MEWHKTLRQVEKLSRGHRSSLRAEQFQGSGCLASSKQSLLPAEEIPATGSQSVFLNQERINEMVATQAEELIHLALVQFIVLGEAQKPYFVLVSRGWF